MAVDYDSFLRWCEKHFCPVVTKGKEIKVNSIFTSDSKQHLWCNVEGGKYGREDGCFHCWKTGEKGTLIGLVMLLEKCSYEEAKEILCEYTPLRDLEDKLDSLFQDGFPQVIENKTDIALPPYSFLISEMDLANMDRMAAEGYLKSRKIPIDGLFYCTFGEYKQRIIIPYYDKNHKLIYWNARHIDKKAQPRYRGPNKATGVGKGDVLYVPKWPANGSKLYLTEGEFNALTLSLSGFCSAACGGKVLSEKQINLLREYKVCLCKDNDKRSIETASPGFIGMIEMAKKLLSAYVPLTYVSPPKFFKDWNDMLVVVKPEIIFEYIKLQEKPLDSMTPIFALADPY